MSEHAGAGNPVRKWTGNLVLMVLAAAVIFRVVLGVWPSDITNSPPMTLEEGRAKAIAKAEDKDARELSRTKWFDSYGSSNALWSDTEQRVNELDQAKPIRDRLNGITTTPPTTQPTPAAGQLEPATEFSSEVDEDGDVLGQLDARDLWRTIDALSLTGVRQLEIAADGRVCSPPDPCVGPAGQMGLARNSRVRAKEFPVGNAAYQALVGRFDNGEPFQIRLAGGKAIIAVPAGARQFFMMANIRTPFLDEASGGFRFAIHAIRNN